MLSSAKGGHRLCSSRGVHLLEVVLIAGQEERPGNGRRTAEDGTGQCGRGHADRRVAVLLRAVLLSGGALLAGITGGRR